MTNRNRRSYSSETALVARRASRLNLEVELENIILRRVSIFEFLHSQGQSRPIEPAASPGMVRYAAGSGSGCWRETGDGDRVKPSRLAQCPLCPDSDQVPQLSEITRWAMCGRLR